MINFFSSCNTKCMIFSCQQLTSNVLLPRKSVNAVMHLPSSSSSPRLCFPLHLCIFQMNPIWRWIVWITSHRPWPVTSVSQRSLSPRVRREAASRSTERICWSRTPGTPSIAVNLPVIISASPLLLSSSRSFSLTDWLTVWLKPLWLSLSCIQTWHFIWLADFHFFECFPLPGSPPSFLTPTFVGTRILYTYLFCTWPQIFTSPSHFLFSPKLRWSTPPDWKTFFRPAFTLQLM